MLGRYRIGLTLLAAMAAAAFHFPEAQAQDRRGRIDVEHYAIEAEINPHTQSLNANVKMRFVPLDDNVGFANLELHTAMQVSKVVDESGQQLPAARFGDYALRVNFPTPLRKGEPQTISFTYGGRLTGSEESPVYGIKFAAIQDDYAYLMYPARWFPINDYTADRYSAELKIKVPTGYRVVSSGIDTSQPAAAGGEIFHFRFTQASFPGSLAVVRGEPARVSAHGVTTFLYFRGEASGMANEYGEEIGKIMTFLTGLYGLPPQANLTVVQTEDGTPNGYAAPGMLFLSPRTIMNSVNHRVLSNQIARQWWGGLLSPATRNHLWITYGMARYAELQYLEHVSGPAAMESEIKDTFVEALTVEQPPVIQAGRLEDYSPELVALTAGKGASVLHMLRSVIGDEPFRQLLKEIPQQYSWKPITTDDFRRVTEQISGQNLQGFFIQWIESTGAPEFRLEYTVFRTQSGFRVMGKISQDLDTFRMPVDLKIETEGNPEFKRVEVVGTASEFVIETFGKPRQVIIDPDQRVMRMSNNMRIAVAIRRGEQFAEIGEFNEALREYQKALDVNRYSSLAHYRVAEVFFLQNNYQSAANEFREALNGDLEPAWTEVWSHIGLGKIFDVTGQRERAVNEYNLAVRTKDNTQGAQEVAAKYLKEPYERPRQNI